jgi:hypothetical protein
MRVIAGYLRVSPQEAEYVRQVQEQNKSDDEQIVRELAAALFPASPAKP